MANYIVSYDLNGPRPTHAAMDAHLKKLGNCVHRILETVWYVKTTKTQSELAEYVWSILSENDRYIVVSASNMSFRKLLVSDKTVLDCWNS